MVLRLSYTRAVQVITVLANLITDAILLWRCYLVWGRRLKAIVLPITLSTISNGKGTPVRTPSEINPYVNVVPVLGFLTVAFTSPESIEAVTDPGDTLLLSEVLSTDDFYLLHPKTAPNGLSQLKMNDFTLQSTILISFVAGSIISNLLLTSMIGIAPAYFEFLTEL
ncbi:hypothetical protein V5O48_004928 [Marasmius crinis-equi]|uniref:Uncharacterized protein n=1 Tax=Marasmius crinis-equi TaxID=585013 RepID=A0ABR3FNN8_9AGAR